MTLLMPHIASRLFGSELMVDPGKLQAFLIGLGARIVEGGVTLPGIAAVNHVAFENGRPSDAMGKVGDPMGRAFEAAGRGDRLVQMIDNVGVIGIEGTLVHKGKFIGQSSGETSYEGLQTQIARAARDPKIKGVVFEVDSFGGEVNGAFETASMIAALSAQKPTLAILTDFALSAGYLMASAARQIVMPETGAAGSIGVVTMHADLSKKLEQDGIKVTLISSGKHKTDGSPTMPLGDDVKAALQARVDRRRDQFAEVVGAARGARLPMARALATEAQVYHGEDAVRAGLVDGIIDPQLAFAEFVKSVH
ncbi:S49 family peptidase [Bradyrhizobium sp. DOA9]|uniref:S49 family peptidase n=1 Tax=Bradyrhizobium sp. DOA9 TaxID=1126627 RepID=UPI000694F8BB|nr:S49 family peptidase [Bradyrhizobium sp. DOA9]GAJ35159.1 minor capsid protein C [Bradyrhizobium sp. DOA9]